MIARDITRTSKVSAAETQQYTEDVNTQLATQFHDIKSILGDVRVLTTCVKLMGSALDLIYKKTDSSAVHTYITVATPACYPTSVSNMRASIHGDMNCITAKILSKKEVLLNTDGTLISGITITRVSAIPTSAPTPSTISENDPLRMLAKGVPYITTFTHDDAKSMKDARLKISIISNSRPLVFNALRLIPMPTVGTVCVDDIGYGSSATLNRLVMNGGEPFAAGIPCDTNRARPVYIHCEPISTRTFSVCLSSNITIVDLNAICMGISRLVAEYNVYASDSYIGYKVTVPAGKKLARIDIRTSAWVSATDNIELRVYTKSEAFNAVDTRSDATLTGSGGALVTPSEINADGTGTLYILAKLTAENGTTPCVTGFDLTWTDIAG